MTIKEFAKECSLLDSPIGDLGNDIIKDKDFPSHKPNKEIFEYLDFQTGGMGTNDVFQEFLAEYQKINNKTLNYIFDYFRENSIQSIDDAIDKKIAKPYKESYGYEITIPLEKEYPKSIMQDLDELGIMNRQPVYLADGTQIDSYMIVKPDLGMGSALRFFCQELQFNYLISLLD